MRKPILLTAAIAVVAGGIALALSQSEQVQNLIYATDTQATEETPVAINTSDLMTETATANDIAEDTGATMTTATTQPTPTHADATVQTEAKMTEIDLNNQAPAAGEEKATEEKQVEEKAAASSEVKIDVTKALQDREMGSKDAPLVIEDFSSLTCPHCAMFHNAIFPKVKENYIDTGKVRWIFRGFPLNDPALKAEMVARCAPDDQYVKMVALMFEQQPKWAFTDNPMGNLSVMVRVGGMNDELFTACVNNVDLQNGIAKKLEEAASKYEINSTPTFVINKGEKVISGVGSYTGFAYDLDQLLSQDPSEKKVPATTENKDEFMPPAAGVSTSPKLDPNAK